MTKPEAPKVPTHGPAWQEGMVGPPDTVEGQALYSWGSDKLTRHFDATHRSAFTISVLMDRAKLKHWSRPKMAEVLAQAEPASGAYKDWLQVLCEIDGVEYVYEPPPSSLRRRFTDEEIAATPASVAKATLAQSDGPLAGTLKVSL